MTDPYKALGLNPLRTYSDADVQKRIESIRRANEIKYSPEEYEAFKKDVSSGAAAKASQASMRKDFTRILRSFVFVRTDGAQVILDKSSDAICRKMKNKGWNIEKDDIPKLTDLPVVRSKDYSLDAKLVSALGAMEGAEFLDWTNAAIDKANENGGSIARLDPGFSDSQAVSTYAVLEKVLDGLMAQRKCMDLAKALRKVKPCVDRPELLTELKRWSVLWELTEDVKAASSDRIEREAIQELIQSNGLARSGADTDEALKALERYCMSAGIIANLSKDEDYDVKCGSCGAYMPKGYAKCTVCGSDLYYRCRCGATTPVSEGKCQRCGMEIALVSNIKDTQRRVEGLVGSCGISELRRVLRDLGEFKKGLDPGVLSRAEALLNEYDGTVAKLDRLMNTAMMCEALETAKRYLAGKPASPDLEAIRERRDRCEAAIADVRRRLREAESKTEREAAQDYAAIMRLCADCREASARLERLRPPRPKDVSLGESGDGFIRVAVTSGDGRPSSYVMVRNAGRAPKNRDDGDSIKTNASEYVDRDIVFGREYYYAVYSERNGIPSADPTYAGPFSVFSNVRKLRASSETKGIRLTFEVPKGCTKVWMARAEGSIPADLGMRKTDLGKDGSYLDTGATKEGASYGYLLVAEYSENRSAPVRTKGVTVTCTYARVPEPPRNFRVEPKGDGRFVASWDPCREDLELYCSKKDLDVNGRTSTEDFVRTRMSRIDTEPAGQDSASFSLEPGTVAYVYPVIMAGTTAVIGNGRLVHNARPPENLRCVYSGGRYVLTLDWPKGSDMTRVCHSASSFPSGPEDGVVVRKDRRGYERDRMIEIRSDDPEVFVSVFSEYPESVFSERRTVRCSRVTEKTSISYNVVNGFLGTRIDFSTSPDLDTLPRMELRASDYGFPRPTDEKVATVENVDLKKGRGSFPLSKEAARTLKKKKGFALFFADFRDFDVYSLDHPRG